MPGNTLTLSLTLADTPPIFLPPPLPPCPPAQVDDVPVPLSEAAMVCVDFDIATWDFIMDEEDPTSSEGMVRRSRGCGLGQGLLQGAPPAAWA